MTAFRTNSFGGMIPAIDDRLLPDPNGAYAENTWLQQGALTGIRTPKLIRNNSASIGKVYRIPINYADSAHFSQSYFVEFQDPNTDIIKAPVVGDTFSRYYFASSNVAPKYNTLARIIAGTGHMLLGVPAPSAPTLSIAGGSATNIARAYVATWVTAYGEEGPPSNPVLATDHPDSTWTLTLTAAAANDINGVNRNIVSTNIYRTVTATNGVTTFFFVATVPVATLTYADVPANTDAVISLNVILPSTTWAAPLSDIQGLTAMPNGMVAGFRANEIWFCEPYRPHAWPAAYAVAVEYPIVGLGVVNQTLVVCTQGYPFACTGTHPSVMSTTKLASFEPCMARGSILSTTEGVYYASPNGLVRVAQGLATNITKGMITKDRWNSLFTLSALHAARMGDGYYAFAVTQQGAFDVASFNTSSFSQAANTGANTGMLLHPNDQRLGLKILTNAINADNVYNDPWSGEVFICRNNQLSWVDLSGATADRDTYIWKSKIVQSAEKKNFHAIKVYWALPTGTSLSFPSDYGTVQLYADGVLRWTRGLVTSGELMLLPSGYTADFFQIVITSKLDVYNIQMATTPKELAQV